MCFQVSPYQYQYLWVSTCAHQQYKLLLLHSVFQLINTGGALGTKVLGSWILKARRQKNLRWVKLKASLIKIQSNQNLSHSCVAEEDWTEEIPRGRPSLHLTFWALHSSFPACPTSRRGFLYVSISCPVRPRWHPQNSVHPICLKSLF